MSDSAGLEYPFGNIWGHILFSPNMLLSFSQGFEHLPTRIEGSLLLC
jgi:hypothetical protein